MDSIKIIRRNKLAVRLWILSILLLYLSLIVLVDALDIDVRSRFDFIPITFIAIASATALYLVYASIRYRSSLSRLRRWLTLLPAALMLSVLCRMVSNSADYDYGVTWQGEGEIHGQFDFGLTTEKFQAKKNPGNWGDWNMHNHNKLPNKIGVSWVGSDRIQHSQIVNLQGKLPFIQQNMQILFIIFPDRVETKVAKRPVLFPLP
jgi:hypothetical protein